MTSKTLKFSVFQLIIDDQEFVLSDFDSIQESDTETDTISNNDGQEILSIKVIRKSNRDDRFILIYINEGDKFPYPEQVYDTSSNDVIAKENPRKPEEIELNSQFFVLIDARSQRVFVSDSRKKSLFNTWLAGKLQKQIVIKSIIQEEQFVDKIKTINSISFTVSPTLLNSSDQDILSNNIVRDIYGFGADSAKVELDYSSASINDRIIEKLNALIGRRNEFDEITVVGRSEDDFESIFNLHEVVSKVCVNIPTNPESKQLDPDSVFNELISNINSHENN